MRLDIVAAFMPAEYIIVVARRLVLTRVYGVVADEDVIGHARRLKADPQFQPDMKQFVDLEAVEPSPMSVDALHAIRGNLNPFHTDAVRAVFAPHDMPFAFSRMFEMLHSDKHMLVTRSRVEGERHVGLAEGESLRLWVS